VVPYKEKKKKGAIKIVTMICGKTDYHIQVVFVTSVGPVAG
jgi:hypothetical protein